MSEEVKDKTETASGGMAEKIKARRDRLAGIKKRIGDRIAKRKAVKK